MNRGCKFSLCKVGWNNDKHQYEPGETIYEGPCSVEVTPGEIKASLLPGIDVSAGEYYLVFPLDDEQLHAYQVPVEQDMMLRGIHIRMEAEAELYPPEEEMP